MMKRREFMSMLRLRGDCVAAHGSCAAAYAESGASAFSGVGLISYGTDVVDHDRRPIRRPYTQGQEAG